MATERSTAPTLPLPARLPASPSTVGALLTKASAAAATGGGAHECPSPRSLLSRILHRGRGGGGGFGCRLRLPGIAPVERPGEENAAAGEDAAKEEARGAAGPKVVRSQVHESPRRSLGKKAEEVSPVSVGLDASLLLLLLLSKSAAELSRMAELRAQMERLVLDVRAEARSSNRANASNHTDSASVVKEPIVFAGGEDAALSRGSRTGASAYRSGNAGCCAAAAMDPMEAELEAKLTRLLFTANNEECTIPRRDHQLETEAKSDTTSVSHSPNCVDNDGGKEYENNDEEEVEEERAEGESPPHGGVSALELERRLHELLQSRHEERIGELESALERARRKLQEKEREVRWWRDTAKLVTGHRDESRFR